MQFCDIALGAHMREHLKLCVHISIFEAKGPQWAREHKTKRSTFQRTHVGLEVT